MDKKKIIIIVGVVLTVLTGILLILSFVSGGDENEPNTGDNNGTDTGNDGAVTLEWWGLWEPDTVVQPLIDKYESENSNVRIVYTQKSFTQYEENLYTRLEEGSTSGTPAPDIFRINNTWLNKFQTYLSPLPADVMDAGTYASTFYPTASDDFTGTDSNIYAIPLEIDGLALFYNIELLENAGIDAPPETWDQLIEDAKKLTVKDGNGQITQAGAGIGTSKNVLHSADILSLLMLQNGVDINQNFNKEVDLNNDRATTALQFYADFATTHEVWSGGLATDLELFYSGKLAMMFAPSWRVFDILNSNPSIEFGVAPTPNIGTEEIYYSMYWGEAVARDSDNPAAAWKFINFLSQQNNLKEFYSNAAQVRAFGEPYSRVDMASLIQDDPYTGAIIQMAPNMKAWKMGEQSFIEETLRTAINDVAENGVDPSAAMLDAEERINSKLATSIQ